MKKPLVGIVMGIDSDLSVMKDAAEVLEEFAVPYELTILSAFRTPDKLIKYASGAEKAGLKVLIAGASGAAHLPGVCAAHTTLPVIGVPFDSKTLQGLDSLLSIVQMPPGVPVATVAIDGARNAGILAAQILGANDPSVSKKLIEYKKKMRKDAEHRALQVETGFQRYLKGTGPL